MKPLGKVTGIVLVLGFCVALAWTDAIAQTTKGKPPAKTDASTTNDLLTAPLFPPDTIAKLKFTADQKKDYDGLVKDFTDELKKIAGAPATSTSSGTNPPPPPPKTKGTKGGGKAMAAPDTPAAKAITLRAEYEDKVEKMCTDPQKKTLEDIRIAKVGNPLAGTPSKK